MGLGQAEHDHRNADPGAAQFAALLDRGHAERIGAGRGQGPAAGNGAVAVGVGLDHGQKGSPLGLALENTDVMSQGVQVDLRPDPPLLPGT